MKQKYVKPELHIERFTLTQSIANLCTADDSDGFGEPNLGDKLTCGWVFPSGLNPWLEANDAKCAMDWGENDEINGVCYHNPGDGVVIFGS